MIVTAAMTIVRKAENSEEIMSENLERSLPNNSTELKGEKSSEILKQRIHHIMELVRLLTSASKETNFQNKLSMYLAMNRHLVFLENSDPEWHFAIFR
jgi:hypothetical protein